MTEDMMVVTSRHTFQDGCGPPDGNKIYRINESTIKSTFSAHRILKLFTLSALVIELII